MDNKGLNINRPLLSVRRFSSISSSPKNENRRNETHLPVRPPSIESCKTGSTSNRKMNSRSVPFGWEHSPGRPKNERNKQIQIMDNLPSIPKLPPGRFFKSRKIIKPECSKSAKKAKKEASGSRNDDHHNENDEAYVDALDTLSRGETCASGVKGVGSDVKASGFIRAEPKTRDFMLGCFLPAARAKASDVPKRISKKCPIKEKPQELKKLVTMDNNHDKVPLTYGPNLLQDVSQDKEEEHDDYDSDYECHEHGKKPSKFCGLIPRFCAVNPVHGMGVRAKLPISPANRTQASSSSSCSFRETASEPTRSAEYNRHRSKGVVLKSESIEPSNLEGSKLYNRLQGPWISVDLSGSIQSTVSEQSDTSSKKKGLSFRELLADKNSNEITATDSQDSIIEKTLYVDTVHIVESPKEYSIPSFTKPQSSFNESLESDMFADDPKHDMKARKCKDLDAEAELDLFDDVKGNQKLKAYESRLFQHPAPPPLPKSPSDSWLCRTLPSVSSKRVPALWIPKYPSAYIVAKDPKAEENIKLQSPQEQMSPMPES